MSIWIEPGLLTVCTKAILVHVQIDGPKMAAHIQFNNGLSSDEDHAIDSMALWDYGPGDVYAFSQNSQISGIM